MLKVHLEHGEGMVRDLNESGIYFLTDVPLKVGDPLKFTLEFQNPETGPISAHCIARIVRVERQGALKGVAASIGRIRLFAPKKPAA